MHSVEILNSKKTQIMIFRSDKKPTGPNLDKSKKIIFTFSGTKLRFLKPVSNGPALKVDGNSIFPTFPDEGSYNIYDESIYLSDNDIQSGLGFAFALYEFKGSPILRNNIGGLKFSAHLTKLKKSNSILDGKIYESVIERELILEYGPLRTSKNRWAMNFPLFWQSLSLPYAPLNLWVCYAVQNMSAKRSESISYFVRTPITHEHDITFCFHALELNYKSGAFELYKEICLFILRSIHLELSPSMQEEFKKLGLPKKFELSKSKPPQRFESANRLSSYNYDLVEDPDIFYKKHDKPVDRYLLK